MPIRHRLAVLMANVAGQTYQHPLLEGIISQAYALDYDLAIFSPFLCYDNHTDFQHGENMIFSLANYEMFDAVLYLPCSFYNDVTRSIVEQDLARRCRKPVIAIESDDSRYHCIQGNDRTAFRNVVEHLIVSHGLTDILCLTGFAGNYQAEERASGYRDAMYEHGLTVPADHIVYGDFWKEAALKLAEEFSSGRRALPQAVVCCCDVVAVTLCNRLVELGMRIPDDLVIAGYDSSPEAEDNVPTITTYMRPIAGMGMRGVLKAHELITGERCEPLREDRGHLIPAESCGCGEDFQLRFEKRQREINNVEKFRSLYDDTPMTEKLNSTTTLNELLMQVMNHFYLLNQWCDYHLCLNDAWDDPDKDSAPVSAYDSYTDTMHLCISCKDQNGCILDYAFRKDDLLPALFEEREKPRAYYITPLHFNARCFGYSALSFGDQPIAFHALYHAWTRNINNSLEFIRIRNNLGSMNQRLFMTSLRDSLAGIYNRHGFRHFSEDIFRKAQHGAPGKKLLLLNADLDQLKLINDNFGHVEGDNAITVVANALNTCFEHNEVSARMGGDEFLVIGCADYTEEIINGYLDYIQSFFDRYNAESRKPYEVQASLGCVCTAVEPDKQLRDYVEEADARMYEDKLRRRKCRQA